MDVTKRRCRTSRHDSCSLVITALTYDDDMSYRYLANLVILYVTMIGYRPFASSMDVNMLSDN